MPSFSRTLGCSAILLSSGIAIATAADQPPPFPPPAYVPAPQVFSWTGFYIGGNAGYGWAKASGTLTTATGTESFTASASGFLGGGQAGYNWQVGPAVFGAEADFQGTTASGPFSATAGPTISATEKVPGLGRSADGSAMPSTASCSMRPVVRCTATPPLTAPCRRSGHSPTPRRFGRGRLARVSKRRSGAAGAPSSNIFISATRRARLPFRRKPRCRQVQTPTSFAPGSTIISNRAGNQPNVTATA
jgi:hypothetical protein